MLKPYVLIVFIASLTFFSKQVNGITGTEYHYQVALTTLELVQDDPRIYLRWYGIRHELSREEIDKLDYIMWKESKWCHPDQLQNAISSAAGCFGIIHSTWLANSQYPWEDRYIDYKNTQTAVTIYQRSGFGPWGL